MLNFSHTEVFSVHSFFATYFSTVLNTVSFFAGGPSVVDNGTPPLTHTDIDSWSHAVSSTEKVWLHEAID
jgi:hypothetical protein